MSERLRLSGYIYVELPACWPRLAHLRACIQGEALTPIGMLSSAKSLTQCPFPHISQALMLKSLSSLLFDGLFYHWNSIHFIYAPRVFIGMSGYLITARLQLTAFPPPGKWFHQAFHKSNELPKRTDDMNLHNCIHQQIPILVQTAHRFRVCLKFGGCLVLPKWRYFI